MLTNITTKALKPASKPYKKSDGGDLKSQRFWRTAAMSNWRLEAAGPLRARLGRGLIH